MEEGKEQMHFGVNCIHLRHDEYADGRCTVAISRYAGPEYTNLDTRTPVPLKVAADLLGISESEVLRRAKAGELEHSFSDNIAKRVAIFTKAGECKVTVNEAAKRLHKTVEEIEQQIAAGEMKAEYPDEFMRIILMTRWDYEKCPLVGNGGVCSTFQPHEGHPIRCLAEISQGTDNTRTGASNELDRI